MKLKLLSSLAAILTFFCLAPNSQAQITDAKNAYKTIVSLTAYDANGAVLRTGTAIFIDGQGTAVANYSVLKDAARAEAVDFKGNKLTVARILGASSNYNVVKFRVEGAKKNEYVNVAATSTLVGTPLYLYRYTTDKKATPLQVLVKQAEDFDKYKYYHTSLPQGAKSVIDCPLLTADCQLVGLVQQEPTEKDAELFAIDATAATDLKIVPTGSFNSDLRAIGIPKALPESQADALTYIYMLSAADSLAYLTAVNDFVTAYPDNAEGYVARAKFYADKNLCDRAEADFTTALSKADGEASTMKTDAVRNEMSKAIFQKAVYKPTPAYADWTLTRAYAEAEKAYALSPQPYYLLQQGRCLFADKKFSEAQTKFEQLAQYAGNDWSDVARTEAWFYAARSLELAGGDSLQVIARIDSALAVCPKPYTSATIQYVLERAQRLQRAGLYRRAVNDYNTYEQTVGTTNLASQFYYIREQAEVECRMYQQALDDIRTAQARSPREPLYRIEEGVILLRAGLNKEAISLCDQLLKDYLPNSSDCYKIKGIAHGELGQKVQAQAALAKAKELGDSTVDSYIERYK